MAIGSLSYENVWAKNSVLETLEFLVNVAERRMVIISKAKNRERRNRRSEKSEKK